MLIAYYPLDEDSGSTATDVAGSNDGTINGATVGQTGILGTTAYDFDGTDDNVSIGSNVWSTSTFSDGVTVSCWMNADSLADSYVIGFEGTISISLNHYVPADIEFHIYDGSDSVQASYDGASTGTWYHIVGTWASGTSTIYIDGVEEDTASQDAPDLDSRSRGNRIGSSYDGGANFDGTVDEVRVYDHALTAAEVQYLYQVTQRNDYVGAVV